MKKPLRAGNRQPRRRRRGEAVSRTGRIFRLFGPSPRLCHWPSGVRVRVRVRVRFRLRVRVRVREHGASDFGPGTELPSGAVRGTSPRVRSLSLSARSPPQFANATLVREGAFTWRASSEGVRHHPTLIALRRIPWLCSSPARLGWSEGSKVRVRVRVRGRGRGRGRVHPQSAW